MKPLNAAALYTSADHQRSYFHVEVPNDTLVEDVLKPAFYVNVSGQCRKGTLIDLVSQDGLLDVQVRVDKVFEGIVKVHPRMIYEDKAARKAVLDAFAADANPASTEVQEPAPDGYKVGYNPGRKLFYVQLKANGKKVREDFQTRAQAIAHAKEHAKLLDKVA
jgi:hypothetical protein